jgi:hypothetical protein
LLGGDFHISFFYAQDDRHVTKFRYSWQNDGVLQALLYNDERWSVGARKYDKWHFSYFLPPNKIQQMVA